VNLGFGLLLKQIPEYGAQYQKWLGSNANIVASMAEAVRTYAYRPLGNSKFEVWGFGVENFQKKFQFYKKDPKS
jgi:hypothetical protein